MARRYLKDGDTVFSTGTFLDYNEEKNEYNCSMWGMEEALYFEGEIVSWDENDKPFIDYKEGE